MLARSHLTEDFGWEVLPIPVCKEDVGEADDSDIGGGCSVSSKQGLSLDGIHAPFQAIRLLLFI